MGLSGQDSVRAGAYWGLLSSMVKIVLPVQLGASTDHLDA